ncbi:c-type cytochrome [Seonamhaeicola maritimus]|uniref:Cytochrome c n=1 Tax=Seonamhaeicola maritimus TaxID=2591822 RepID=A0A5C7GN58_9FLAO|nr:cytochrome c [Seonamhaeicola maritimus]TXG39517.1 cytochrome c [Seonamhaeicola maritimus]
MYPKQKNNTKTVCFLPLLVSFLVIGCKDSKEKINIEKGQELFTSVGCATCHSLSGDKLYGPSLNSILGTKTKVIRNDKEYSFIIDKNYIKKSIIDPDYEKPILFKSNKMPKPSLTNFEVDCITNYLLSINNTSKE